MDYQALIELCRGRRVWIQTHNFPDADAVGSAYGLAELLGHFGIEASLCHDGEIDRLSCGRMLRLIGMEMQRAEDITDMAEDDMIILVDCQKATGNTTDLPGQELAVIDHHPVTNKIGYLYSDLRIVGACSAIIAEYFKEAGIAPSARAATALIYGMRTDTLSFSRGVTEFDIEMFGYLFPYADNRMMKQLETNNLDMQDLKGYQDAIDNIRVYGVTGFSYLDFECPDALVAILSDFLLSLVEIEVVILYARRQGGIKFSVRSERSEVHAGMLTRECLAGLGSGGGHASMAGGFVPDAALPADREMRYEFVREHCTDVIREMGLQIL